MFTKDQILKALSKVIHPMKGKDIVALGLISEIGTDNEGISMFRSEKINVPVLGLVENMSWFTPAELPENKYFIFGKGGGRSLSIKMN